MSAARLLLLATLILAFCVGESAQALAAKRVALVIGNGAYANVPALANPPNDAEDMAAALKGVGFTVISGVNLDKARFDEELKDFAAAVDGADVGVFYYSGHGMQVGGVNYLVPTDARLSTQNALDFEAVRLDLIQRIMERGAQTNILFLDACRNNPFVHTLSQVYGTRGLEVAQGLAATQSGTGTLISYSTRPDDVALDGEGRNSPFTGPLVKRIASEDHDILEILREVRKDVLAATGNKQLTWDTNALTDRFYFKATVEFGSVPQPGGSLPNSAARSEWSLVKDTSSIDVLNAFKDKYKDQTLYVALANERLAALAKSNDDSRAFAPPRPIEPTPTAVQSPAPKAQSAPAPQPVNTQVASLDPLSAEEALGLSRGLGQKIQAVLTKRGGKIAYVGGYFGNDTRDAIRAFQKSRSELETGYLTSADRDDLLAEFKRNGVQAYPYFMSMTPEDLGRDADPRLLKRSLPCRIWISAPLFSAEICTLQF